MNAWDFGSFDVIERVAEGLFGHDFSDPDLGIIPKLAEDYGTWNGNRYTVELKQGIQFHDGTPFDAYAVEFTFDRLQYFMDNGMSQISHLYQYYDYIADEMKPIINDVHVINDFTVEFEINGAYGILEPLLAFEAALILSPTSTPSTDYIDTYSDVLVGTGPFVYEYHDPDVETSFRAFENYWDGKANIDHLKFMYIYDVDERANLLESGVIHMVFNPPTYRRGEFEGNPDFTLDSIQSSTFFYLAMNNYWIDRDLREAISYAFDYDYLINDIRGGEAARVKSPIPNGIVYSDDSFNIPTTDVIHARTVMQSMGYGTDLGLYDDGAWESSTFLSLTYSYGFGHYIREQLFYSLEESLGKIGIQVIDDGMDGWEFYLRWSEQDGHTREELQLYWSGWGADYNDPSNYINNLFTNRTRAANLALYDGYNTAVEAGRDPFNTWDNVQLLMEIAITETDPGTREMYYARIQQLLVEEDMPVVYLCVPFNHVWYSSEIQGFQMNSLRKPNFYGVSGVTRDVPDDPDTTPPVTEIYLDGTWGWNGWFVSDVLVTLEATDPSGIMVTWYTFDEGATVLFYTGPFWVSENTTFYYGSVDTIGYGEIPNYIEIKIDKTLPTTEIFLSGMEGMNSWYVSDVFVSFEATDDLSGVLVTYYTYDGEEIFFPIEPFLIEESTTFYYGSVDFAGNMETKMITIEIYKSPSAITDKIIEELENLDVPPGAQKEVDKALVDLQVALEKFNEERFYSGIHEIFNAIKHLMDAQDAGADVQSIINVLVEMVQNMVDNAINDAIEMVGEDDKFVIRAQEEYTHALAKVSEGKYDEAINLFRNAYKNAILARMRGFLYHIWKYFCYYPW